MSRKILEYGIDRKTKFLNLKEGYKVLCLQTQYEQPFVWIEIDEKRHDKSVAVYIVPTGANLPFGAKQYVGTYQIDNGRLVFHVYFG